jgi:peptidoglycan/LPS O-acetylase OafA/YrhL
MARWHGFKSGSFMGRSNAIDVLRALAVTLVFGAHLFPCPAETNPTLHFLTAAWGKVGWVGVDLFFVLSGFLVSGLLFREHQKFGRISATGFLIRRGLKIYPAFWLMIGVSVAAFAIHGGLPHIKSILCELLFLQNYLSPIWNHTWSLAVEEHFYLLLLFLIMAGTRGRRATNPFSDIPLNFAVVAAGCLLLRVVTRFTVPYEDVAPRVLGRHFFPTHLRMDALFFGVCLSYFYHYHNQSFMAFARKYRLALAGASVPLLLIGLFVPLASPAVFTWGYTGTYLGGGCLLISALTWNSDSSFARAIAYMGSRSYSIYLWHMPVFRLASGWLLPAQAAGTMGARWYVYAACSLAGSILVGLLAAAAVEFPVLRLRDRLFPSRSNPLEAPADSQARAEALRQSGTGTCVV